MLDELYAQLPEVECKGLCHDTCTVIDASQLERDRVTEAGVELPEVLYPLDRMFRDGAPPRCPALSPLNTCRVYRVRPFICRAFGMVLTNPETPIRGPMMCDYGCVPDGVISVAELNRVLLEIEELSRHVTGVDRRPPWARR